VRSGPALSFVLALVAVGCTVGGGSAPPSSVRASPVGSPTAGASGIGPSAVSASLPAVVLDPILADAASRTGMPKEALEVVTAESKTWPDGALGCPQPGIAYTQVVVDGYQVVIRAGARTLDYRGSGPGRFRLCEAAKPS